VPESKSARSAFSVEQGDSEKRDPKEGASRGWAKLRATAKVEAQTTVSALRLLYFRLDCGLLGTA